LEENKNIEQQLDSMFRDSLNNAEIPAPDGIWESIAQNILQPSITPSAEVISNTSNSIFSSISTIGKIAIIATTAAVTGLSVYLLSNEPTQNPKTEIVAESKNVIENEEKLESVEIVTVIEDNTEETNTEETIVSNENTDRTTDNNVESSNQKNLTNKPKSQDNTSSPTNIANTSSSQATQVISKTDNSTKTSLTQTPSTSKTEEKASFKMSDTIICFTTSFKPTWAFGQTKISNPQIVLDNNTITSLNANILSNTKNKWFIVKATLANGDKVERRVKLSSSQIELSVSNSAQDAAYCQILNGNLFSHILWYINNQLIEEDVKHIVYYRNMEFETGTSIDLKIVTTDLNTCKDSLHKDISCFMDVLSDPVIPNVITPNNDGLNDKWEIQISGEVYFNVRVLGINNTILFQSNNKDDKWDGLDIQGNMVPSGSYLYIVDYQFPNQKVQTKSGIIQLIRN